MSAMFCVYIDLDEGRSLESVAGLLRQVANRLPLNRSDELATWFKPVTDIDGRDVGRFGIKTKYPRTREGR